MSLRHEKGPLDSRRKIGGARVLVCSLDNSFHTIFEADCMVYQRHYRMLDTALISGIPELLVAIEKRYDIVHLLCGISLDGLLTDQNMALSGTELIRKCCDADVKLLWIANENNAPRYIRGFRVRGMLGAKPQRSCRHCPRRLGLLSVQVYEKLTLHKKYHGKYDVGA